MAAKQGYINKTLKLKSNNAKYKVSYSKLTYKYTSNSNSKYSYSKQISSKTIYKYGD